jgi:UDP-GlcNAc:undecaprenyl-phosphate GlcNAc-1-phosphate transferase
MKYLLPFLVALVISSTLCFLALLFSRHIKIKQRKGARHLHVKNISRFGGLAIIVAFFLTVLFDPNLFLTKQLIGMLVASLVILLVGIVDDIWEISWKKQLFFQLIAIAIVLVSGIRMEYITDLQGGAIFFSGSILMYSIGMIIVSVWILLLMNALNWIDGADGLSGGVSAIAAASIFILSLRPEVNQPPIAIVSVALLGALCGFLVFNAYPAKIMAGTSGSLFMGFVLAVLSIIAGTKIATTMLILAIPIIDALWVIFERLRARRSIFEPDSRHIHHRLIGIGWSHHSIWILFSSITALIALIALNTRAVGKAYSMILVSVIILLSFFILRYKFGVNVKSEKGHE